MQADFIVDGRMQRAEIDNVVIAGWTGRDHESVEHHIRELEALGVARPREVPMYYRVATQLLTSDRELQVIGEASSGEVEVALVQLDKGLYVGVASDHTDRKVEAYGVTVSKQMCPKPIGAELWRYDDVADHWDALILRSYVTRKGHRSLYQEGAVTRMRAPEDLIQRFAKGGSQLPPGTVMFCGTLPAIGEVAGGEVFEIELHDPVLARSLVHRYSTRPLPIVD